MRARTRFLRTVTVLGSSLLLVVASAGATVARSELFTIEIPLARTANPWLEIHGSLSDDPTFDDFVSESDSYHRERNVEGSEP